MYLCLIENGNWTWRVLGLLAGLLIVLNSFLGFFLELTRISPLMAILNMYTLVFGVIMAILEYQSPSSTMHGFVVIIKTEARFLTRPYGRGAFYFFCGILFVAKGGIISFLIGLFVCGIGVLLYTSSKNAHRALQQMKLELSGDEHYVQQKFNEFDSDADGHLSPKELSHVCVLLGSSLDYNELESVILPLDSDGDGKISFLEFSDWWLSKDTDDVSLICKH